LDLLGQPLAEEGDELELIEVSPDQVQLVAYEALVEGVPVDPRAVVEPDRLFDQPGDQLRVL
jgi:hypothetical protein